MGEDMDYKQYTDEQLEEAARAIQTEQERRSNVLMIPSEIQSLQQKFIEGGGDVSNLPSVPVAE